MKVILQQDVKKMGKRGDLVEVANGYGRNYLIPRGLAVEATSGNMKAHNQEKVVEKRQRNREENEARRLGTKLAKETIRVPAKSGEGGRLFGSVTGSDIAAAAQEQTGIKLDRRKLVLDEPIKSLGSHRIPYKLLPGEQMELVIQVVEGDG